jgi:tyrosyl-tRNA synthetase
LNEAQLLQVMEGVPTVNVTLAQLTEGYDLVSLLADTQIFPSKGEARKMWQSGGIGINKEKIGADFTTVTKAQLLQGKYILLQKGKKNYYLVIAA